MEAEIGSALCRNVVFAFIVLSPLEHVGCQLIHFQSNTCQSDPVCPLLSLPLHSVLIDFCFLRVSVKL